MTANQLKYWELRWKQHYEKLYIEELQRSNIAKETETERHNRKQERIATQQNVLRSIELNLKAEELSLKWEDLAEKKKANMMSWLFTAQELDQKERRLKADIEKILADRAIAIAQFKVDAQHNMNQDFAKFVDSNAKALKEGWGKGAVAIGLASLESIPGIANYNNILSELESQLGLNTDLKLQVAQSAKSDSDKFDETDKSYADVAERLKSQETARAIEMYGPDVKKRTGAIDRFGNKISMPSNATSVSQTSPNTNSTGSTSGNIASPSSAIPISNGVSITVGSPPVSTNSNVPKSSTSGVVYSGGSSRSKVYGPHIN